MLNTVVAKLLEIFVFYWQSAALMDLSRVAYGTGVCRIVLVPQQQHDIAGCSAPSRGVKVVLPLLWLTTVHTQMAGTHVQIILPQQ